MDYPDIINQHFRDGELRLTLNINSELDAFDGHFDQFPIVPGVVQIAWAKHYFERLVAPKIQLTDYWQVQKITNLKFQQVITSGNQVELVINFDQIMGCFTFSFTNREHKFSSGKVFISHSELNN